MTSLLDLPVEILEHIVTDVHVADIESFAASCRLFAMMAKAKRDLHLHRKKTYTEVTFNMDDFADMKTILEKNPLMFLQDVCKDDALLHYPRRLNIEGFHHNSICDWNCEYITRPPPVLTHRQNLGASFTETHKQSIKGSLKPHLGEETYVAYLVQGSYASHLVQNITRGNYETSICVLLLLLSNLEQLNIKIKSCKDLWFKHMINISGFYITWLVMKKRHHPSLDQQSTAIRSLAVSCADSWNLDRTTAMMLFHRIINVQSETMRQFRLSSPRRSLSVVPYKADNNIFRSYFSAYSVPPPGDPMSATKRFSAYLSNTAPQGDGKGLIEVFFLDRIVWTFGGI